MKTRPFLLFLSLAVLAGCRTSPPPPPVIDADLAMERYRAILSIEQPQVFQREFPPSTAEAARIRRSQRLIEAPPTADEVLERLDARQRAEVETSLQEMLDPEQDVESGN